MTNDLDRALIALRVSRDHGHGAVLNDAEVPALLAEIERLRQWELVGREWAAKTDWMQSRDAPVRWLGKHRADALREEIERLTAERDEARAERDALAKDAARYRFLSCKGVPPHSRRWSRWRLEYWNGEWWDQLMKEELDAAIDAQIEQERSDG